METRFVPRTAFLCITVSRVTPAFPAHPTGRQTPCRPPEHPGQWATNTSVYGETAPSYQQLVFCCLWDNLYADVLLQESWQVLPWNAKATAIWAQFTETDQLYSSYANAIQSFEIKYADLQLKPICWETNEGELVKVTFQPCLIIPLNYYIWKKLLLSQTLCFPLLITGNGSHHVCK